MDRELSYHSFELSLSLFGPVVLKILGFKNRWRLCPAKCAKISKNFVQGLRSIDRKWIVRKNRMMGHLLASSSRGKTKFTDLKKNTIRALETIYRAKKDDYASHFYTELMMRFKICKLFWKVEYQIFVHSTSWKSGSILKLLNRNVKMTKFEIEI